MLRQEKMPPVRLAVGALIAIAAAGSLHAQTLCEDFHVPAAHIGNVEGCVFTDANNTSTITFSAPAVIQWDRGFKINAGQTLRFAFPGMQNGAVLNRDLSGGNSNIAGTVSSDGRVILINPAGDIAIQSGGLIDADGGFLASTLDTPDDDSLIAGNNAEFRRTGISAIDNRGTIRSARGDVILISGSINNFGGGRILAQSGSVHLAAGSYVRFAAAGEPRITVVDGENFNQVNNFAGGTIEALGNVGLSAFAAAPANDGQRNPVVSNHGIIRTSSDGRVFLRALPGGGQTLNSSSGDIDTGTLTFEGNFINEGAVLERDDGANPTAPSATRQFPRLASNTLTQTPNSDLRLSRLSFSHLNGLDSKSAKKKKSSAKKNKTKPIVASNTTRGTSSAERKKKPTTTGKKIVLRRGTFFGKKTK